MQVVIRLLGGFAVRVDGRAIPAGEWRRRQATALVKLLALAPGRTLHREQVIDALWPDVAVDEAAPRLHKAAHFARRSLGGARTLVLADDTVSLFPDADVDRRRRVLRAGRRGRARREVDRQRHRWRRCQRCR